MKKILYRALAALMASSICLSKWAAVTASLDKTRATVGERVRLMVQNTGSSDQQPNISALQQDFDVLGTQRGSSVQIVNGHMSSQTQLTVLLAPKHDGTIRIAPIQWGADQSNALELVVGAGASNGSNPDPTKPGANTAESQITLSGTLDQKQPYVQSAVVLSLRLNVGVPIAQASLDLQGSSDVLVKQIGQDQQHTESRNGRSYQIIERKYLLIPQRSGAISLKGPVFQAQVQDQTASNNGADIDDFFGSVFGQGMGRLNRPMRPLHLQADAIEMNVLPRPATADASNWLPAQKLTLEESWRPEKGTLHVGEPLTRHLHLSALGVTAGQLPDLAEMMPVPDGIKKYPDQAKNNDGLQGATLQASRDQDIALIASAPGHYVLPALRLAWWDTVNHTQHNIELPERSLDIVPATGTGANYAATGPGAAPPPAATPPVGGIGVDLNSGNSNAGTALLQAARVAQNTPWLWVSLALAVLWLGTLLLWWRTRTPGSRTGVVVAQPRTPGSTPAAPPNASKALAALQQACSANDAPAARQHVLAWAASMWPASPPRGLQAVTERLGDDRFTPPLQQLDRACYTNAAWNGQALAQAFAHAPKAAAAVKAAPQIPDLYA